MKDLVPWLLHEDRSRLFEVLVAAALNLFFLALTALLLWLLDQLPLAVRLAKGYGILWPVVALVVALLRGMHRLLRWNPYDAPNAYVSSGLVTSGLLHLGWVAFAVLTVQSVVVGASTGMAVLLHTVAALSCLVASLAVSSFYQGTLYRLAGLLLVSISLVVFHAWPALARTLYGWFFALF